MKPRSILCAAAHRVVPAVLLALLAPLPGRASSAVDAPPDLRLEWVIDGRSSRVANPLQGVVGEVVRLDYQLRNVGGAPAFAAVLSATTTLGPLSGSQRVQPGPKPGESMRRSLRLTLVIGVRQVCIQARLQTVRATEAGDPNPEDNLLCRHVIVKDRDNAASPPGPTSTRTFMDREH